MMVIFPLGLPDAIATERYVCPMELPKYSPKGVRDVSVALRATDMLASVEVMRALGKIVPVKVTAPLVGGESTVNTPYTPVPSAAFDAGTRSAVAARLAAAPSARTTRVRGRVFTG